MRKILECDRCRFNIRNSYLVCHDYPAGQEGDSCPHFAPDPDAKPEELWEPEETTYYNGELILQPQQHLTREEQLELLDTHPLFTGRCPGVKCPSLTLAIAYTMIALSAATWMIQCEIKTG